MLDRRQKSVIIVRSMDKLAPKFICLLFLGFISSSAASLGAEDSQNPPKIGLVLSGGAARAAAHIGILKIFDREKIPIDCIAATSFGALVGGLYSLGYPASEGNKALSLPFAHYSEQVLFIVDIIGL